MKNRIGHIISWETGGSTDSSDTHFVYHGVRAVVSISQQDGNCETDILAGQSFPTAIVDTTYGRLTLIDRYGRDIHINLKYAV